MGSSLDQILRERRHQALIADAEFLRSYPACDERVEHARRLLRQVMLDSALGRVTSGERAQVFEILKGVADLRESHPLASGGHSILKALLEDATQSVLADGEPPDTTWARINVPGVIHPITNWQFCHFLDFDRPRHIAGVYLADVDYGLRLRLIWSSQRQHFCRLLTVDETVALRTSLPFVSAPDST